MQQSDFQALQIGLIPPTINLPISFEENSVQSNVLSKLSDSTACCPYAVMAIVDTHSVVSNLSVLLILSAFRYLVLGAQLSQRSN